MIQYENESVLLALAAILGTIAMGIFFGWQGVGGCLLFISIGLIFVAL